MRRPAHWGSVYGNKQFDAVSWYSPHLDVSLGLIEQLCPQKSAAIVDVGGESTLVDDLLDRGYTNLSVLDISTKAIEFTRERLGPRAQRMKWHIGDITQCDFGGERFDLWHDRAVFHFLTDQAARRAYVDQIRRFVKPGGHMLMATFGPQGPLQCSGLDVTRYDTQSLQREFEPGFKLLRSQLSDHRTPLRYDGEGDGADRPIRAILGYVGGGAAGRRRRLCFLPAGDRTLTVHLAPGHPLSASQLELLPTLNE